MRETDHGKAMVAIKILRANELMRKSAEKEIRILERLQSVERESKRYIVQMFSRFSYRDHLCIVFECLWDDCREALRKLTKGKGMSLAFVRPYSQQLLLGLRHMEKCSILHGDIKPDNILMSSDHTTVKFCDFGTATELENVEVNAYIMSRCYRAPEIIIGCKANTAADVFALGCTLYELFTGKCLAAGKGNHDQLRKTMELKGKLPNQMIKKGTLWRKHFDENFVFKPDADADPRHASAEESDGSLRLKIERLKAIMDTFPKTNIKDLVLERVGPERCKSASAEDQKYVQRGAQFAELINEMITLDPSSRLTPRNALAHLFFT